jgi:hypothetical protein
VQLRLLEVELFAALRLFGRLFRYDERVDSSLPRPQMLN